VINIPPVLVERVLDSVGAGDAFDAGFVAGHLKGLDLAECGKLGSAVGAAALNGTGDYETIPAWPEALRRAATVATHDLERTS
jgi:2-dehydro-3-deoxygluconokinase